GNEWYKEAIKHAVDHQITEDITIKSVTAPYFLATKIEAFKSRGNYDCKPHCKTCIIEDLCEYKDKNLL
ncbi:hypothetical protein MXD98_16545, partial [Legionella pneumophila]|nr:hypothetical protein [Legionella pneumophila]